MQRLATAVRRRALDHEPALGADRDDQRVLDHLRLHQAEDLGAEVLAAGPTTAARRVRPCRRAGACPRCAASRRRSRTAVAAAAAAASLLGSSLNERYGAAAYRRSSDAEVVGAQHRAARPTGSCAGSGPRRGCWTASIACSISSCSCSARVVVAALGIEPGAEQLDEQRGDRRDGRAACAPCTRPRTRSPAWRRYSAIARMIVISRPRQRRRASTSPLSPSSSSSPAPHGEERVWNDVADALDVLGRRIAGRSRRSSWSASPPA